VKLLSWRLNGRNWENHGNTINIPVKSNCVACIGETRKTCKFVADLSHGKTTLGRFKCRWKDITEACVKELALGGLSVFI
jgi:hypothetical protein